MTLSLSLLALALAGSSPDVTPATSPLPFAEDAPAPELPHWSGTLSLGATWTAGNTETETVTGAFNSERRGEKDRWTFDAFVNYGSTTDTATDVKSTTTNNSGGSAKYDYFQSEKLFYYGTGSGKVDHVATLNLRTVLGAGLGYQWKETEKVKWATDLGLSWVDEDFEDNSADASFLAARLGSNLAYQISKTSVFEQVTEVLPSLEDSNDLIAKLDNRLKLNITGKWIAQIQYVLDFDGSVPDGKKETDHRVVLSVGWSFGS